MLSNQFLLKVRTKRWEAHGVTFTVKGLASAYGHAVIVISLAFDSWVDFRPVIGFWIGVVS